MSAVDASLHDEIVRAERDRIIRELKELRDEAQRIRALRPRVGMAIYLRGYSDALGDLIDDLGPKA